MADCQRYPAYCPVVILNGLHILARVARQHDLRGGMPAGVNSVASCCVFVSESGFKDNVVRKAGARRVLPLHADCV